VSHSLLSPPAFAYGRCAVGVVSVRPVCAIAGSDEKQSVSEANHHIDGGWNSILTTTTNMSSTKRPIDDVAAGVSVGMRL